jgi:hypothetical protein
VVAEVFRHALGGRRERDHFGVDVVVAGGVVEEVDEGQVAWGRRLSGDGRGQEGEGDDGQQENEDGTHSEREKRVGREREREKERRKE